MLSLWQLIFILAGGIVGWAQNVLATHSTDLHPQACDYYIASTTRDLCSDFAQMYQELLKRNNCAAKHPMVLEYCKTLQSVPVSLPKSDLFAFSLKDALYSQSCLFDDEICQAVKAIRQGQSCLRLKGDFAKMLCVSAPSAMQPLLAEFSKRHLPSDALPVARSTDFKNKMANLDGEFADRFHADFQTTIQGIKKDSLGVEKSKSVVEFENYDRVYANAMSRLNQNYPNLKELLKMRHNFIIDHNQSHRDADSKFNLDQIRANEDDVRRFCAMIPKGGMLHVHPYGLLGPQLIIKMLTELNPVFKPADLFKIMHSFYSREERHHYRQLLMGIAHKRFSELTSDQQQSVAQLLTLPPQNQCWNEFERIFVWEGVLFGQEQRKKMAFERALYTNFIQDVVKKGIFYVEFTDDFNLAGTSFLKKLKDEMLDRYGVHMRWNYSFVRTQTEAKIYRKFSHLLESITSPEFDSVLGVDLVGDEHDSSNFVCMNRVFRKIDAYNQQEKCPRPIHRTIHAGEFSTPYENIRDAILLNTERIGHGVQLMKGDPIVIEMAMQSGLHVEVNMVSNLKLGAVPSPSEHPFLNMARLGLRVSLSTDDEGILATDINKECETAIQNSDISYRELKEMFYHSIEDSFESETSKRTYLARLDHEYKQFEARIRPLFSAATKKEDR